MSYSTDINKSLHGREIGLQYPSSGKTGSTFNPTILLGPEAMKLGITTAESTAGILAPYGVSLLTTGSSAVHTLAPPIPGIAKFIYSSGGATAFVKTRNDETLESSRGSTFTTARFVGACVLHLVGLTTARWLINGMGGDSGDSANSPAISLATST